MWIVGILLLQNLTNAASCNDTYFSHQERKRRCDCDSQPSRSRWYFTRNTVMKEIKFLEQYVVDVKKFRRLHANEFSEHKPIFLCRSTEDALK
jgi:hypothetical protein